MFCVVNFPSLACCEYAVLGLDKDSILSYYHDTEFLKTAPLLRPSLAEERGRLTQTLTQTTQKMGGNNGVDAPKEQLRPEQTGLSSHVCAYFCSLILILDRELQKSRSKRYKACSDVPLGDK